MRQLGFGYSSTISPSLIADKIVHSSDISKYEQTARYVHRLSYLLEKIKKDDGDDYEEEEGAEEEEEKKKNSANPEWHRTCCDHYGN